MPNWSVNLCSSCLTPNNREITQCSLYPECTGTAAQQSEFPSSPVLWMADVATSPLKPEYEGKLMSVRLCYTRTTVTDGFWATDGASCFLRPTPGATARGQQPPSLSLSLSLSMDNLCFAASYIWLHPCVVTCIINESQSWNCQSSIEQKMNLHL